MASTESALEVHDLALTPADLDDAQALVVESGWNQVRADWEIFLALGHVLKVCHPDGGVAATAATLPYAGGFGWISMVLVTRAKRRQGIARHLLQRCIARLRDTGRVSVLDATPAGREVYRQLGFADGWPISRWHRAHGAVPSAPADFRGVQPIQPHDLPAVTALDVAAFGCARGELLAKLMQRSSSFACVSKSAGVLRGYLLGRDGRNATHVGPIVAEDDDTAIALLAYAFARLSGPVLTDVLDCHGRVTQALARWGFAIERPFTRMTLDRERPFGEERLMVAIAGPELG